MLGVEETEETEETEEAEETTPAVGAAVKDAGAAATLPLLCSCMPCA